MATIKRKFEDEFQREFQRSQPVLETTGCGAYTATAIQYPLIGGTQTLYKLLIGAVCLVIPVVGSWLLTGYGLRVIRRVMAGDYRLPEWDDFAGDFVGGLAVTVGLFIFGILLSISMVLVVTIPIVLLFGVPMAAFTVARFADSGDFTSFFDILGAYRAVFYRMGDALMMTIGSFITIFVFSILIGLGTICLFIPGMMAAAALALALAFNVGVFGLSLIHI